MIRPATIDDVPHILVMGSKMIQESRYKSVRYNPAKASETVIELIKNEDGFCWVGQGAMMLGYATSLWHSDDKVSSELALYVEPEYRGGMTAIRLIKQYVKWAKERGAVMIEAGVSTELKSERTARLYEICGFRIVGPVLTFGE